MWGGVQAALCCLRFFTDDRGRTIVERGLDHVRGGVVEQQFIRFLAIFAAVSACFFFFYNVPAQWIGMHSDPWPEDHHEALVLQRRHLRRRNRHALPDPDLPMPTKHSGYINTDGELVLPEGAEMPAIVPFEPGEVRVRAS